MREETAGNDGAATLAGKHIIVFHYSHMDWAWRFTRRWHEDRYVRIFDEALDLIRTDPSFCFFVDSICESLVTYFRYRPEALEEWRRLISEGRICLVSGHYANLRPATAPEETYIRNLEIGYRQIREWFPEAEPLGFANLDTAIGHSQLPQVLALAGIRYYLAGRPEMAFELENRPKLFRWQGFAGSEMITCIQHYGIMADAFMGMASTEPMTVNAAKKRFLQLLEPHASLPVDTLPAFFSMDDMRFMRCAVSDRRIDMNRVIEHWNTAEVSDMTVGTPDRFFHELQRQRDLLPLVRGTVDQADVGYNGPFPQAALRPWRDEAAARLVEAELYLALANLRGMTWPEETVSDAWRLVLRAQSHAVQFLFAEDVDDMRLDLQNAIRTAGNLRNQAFHVLVSPGLPQDADRITLLSPLPYRQRQIVTIPIIRTDTEIAGYELHDAEGQLVPQQCTAPKQPGRFGEWGILIDLELPACGFVDLTLHRTAEGRFPVPENLSLSCTIQAGPWQLTWEDGFLVAVKSSECDLRATEVSSLLEPVFHRSERRGWMPTRIDGQGEKIRFSRLRRLENGPVRWRFERRGSLGPHHVVQDICVTNTGEIVCQTRINHGIDEGYFGLAMPCDREQPLQASIPFGIEERHSNASVYCEAPSGNRIIERAIPGIFYARDWVSGRSRKTGFSLVVMDGDRYWYRPPECDMLVHFLLHATMPYEEGWEMYAEMDRAGYMQFEHILIPGLDPESCNKLTRIADRQRFPVRTVYRQTGSPPGNHEWLRICPENLRLLACRKTGGEWEIRLVNESDRAGEVTLTVLCPIQSARLTDFRGRTLAIPVKVRGVTAGFTVSGWQIVTLRLIFTLECRETNGRGSPCGCRPGMGSVAPRSLPPAP